MAQPPLQSGDSVGIWRLEAELEGIGASEASLFDASSPRGQAIVKAYSESSRASAEAEARTLVEGAVDADSAAVRLQDLLDDR